MTNLTRESFIKSLLAASAAPTVACAVASPDSLANGNGITASEAASIFEKYKVVPSPDKSDAFDFYIGDERYTCGFLSNISLWGIKFATKERHMIIYNAQGGTTTLHAVRTDGKWQYTSTLFPRDFPIEDLAAAVDSFV